MFKFVKEYFIPFIIVIVSSVSLLSIPYSNSKMNRINTIKKINNIKVVAIEKDIEELNANNSLLKKDKFNNIAYYLYLENDNYKSYFIDEDLNQEVDILSLIKVGKENDFIEKVKFLLNLKYPKFVVEDIISNATKAYEVNENELIIHYYGTTVLNGEHLLLKVNYNEVKEFLNITVKLDKEYKNEDGYNYDSTKKTIAFSYDDGPNGQKTLDLIQTLNDNKAHATFFMVGNRMNSYPTVVTTVHNSGNEIGSHTYNHCNLKKTDLDKILAQEKNTEEIYYNLTNDTLKLTRPPYGAISDKVKNGMNTIFVTWNVDTEDWRYRDVEHIKEAILNNVSDGDIVLMHDLYDTTVEATKEVLPILYEQGFQVVSVSELASIKGRTLENNNIYRSLK